MLKNKPRFEVLSSGVHGREIASICKSGLVVINIRVYHSSLSVQPLHGQNYKRVVSHVISEQIENLCKLFLLQEIFVS